MTVSKTSILGAVSGRVRADVRIPREFLEPIQDVCERIGLPKNAFYSLAGALLLVELIPLLSRSKKREDYLNTVSKIFQKALKTARERL